MNVNALNPVKVGIMYIETSFSVPTSSRLTFISFKKACCRNSLRNKV